MQYYNNITTLNDLKNEFRNLCLKLHPDTSGYDSQQDFITMHKEFKTVAMRLKNTSTHTSDKTFNADKFYNIVKLFDGLENIAINFIGSFIWLTDIEVGAMYKQKDIIKAIKIEGLNAPRWAKKKVSWYFSPIDYKQVGSKNKSLEQLKATYGSNVFKTKQAIKITA